MSTAVFLSATSQWPPEAAACGEGVAPGLWNWHFAINVPAE